MSKEIETIDDLTPNPENANRGSARGHSIIEQSIRARGAGRSGLAASDGTMIAGDQTLLKMAELGMKIKPVHTNGDEWVVVIRDDIEPGSKEAVLLGLEDNRSAQVGISWEPAVLAAIAARGDVDTAGLFTSDEWRLASAPALPEAGQGGDEFDPTPEEGETRTALGQLWSIGCVHRLLVGDCTDAANVARLMGNQKIEGVFTSPPYDQQRTYEGNMAADWLGLMRGAFGAALPYLDDDAQVFVNLGLVHRDGRVVRYWDAFIEWMEDAAQEWPLFGWYVWDKLNGMPGDWNGRLAPAHEWVFHFCRDSVRPQKTVASKSLGRTTGATQRIADGTTKQFTQNGSPVQPFKIPDSVIRVYPHMARGEIDDHPAVFPVALPTQFMEAYSADLWYEPFGGSGTSHIAAHRTGRRCYGMEISCRYADVILRRATAENLECTLMDT